MGFCRRATILLWLVSLSEVKDHVREKKERRSDEKEKDLPYESDTRRVAVARRDHRQYADRGLDPTQTQV